MPFFSSLIIPMSIPAAIFLIGTPASMSAKQPPQTDAMEDDPLEDKISETIRTVYGNSSCVGIRRHKAFSAKLPWPISRLPGPRKLPVSPVQYGGGGGGGGGKTLPPPTK